MKSTIAMVALLGAVNAVSGQEGNVRPGAVMDPNGTEHISGLIVPPSSYSSPQAVEMWVGNARSPPGPGLSEGAEAARAYYGRYNDALVARMRVLYAVDIQSKTLGGVRVEIISPKAGVLPRNRSRVLMNLHGGAFTWGEGSGGEVESIPIASVGKIEVLTVAYREGPEYSFPAASEDVASVYRALLKNHRPQDIGIYGCSAGGILTAEAVAWFDKLGLPQPAAVGMFCGAAGRMSGDSLHLAPALMGGLIPEHHELTWPYFSQAHVDENDPLVYPINSPKLLAKFPPSLLITGSRDFAMSSLFQTQRELVKHGVEVELHVWDGVPHSFFTNPDLPESKEVYDVIVRFFDRHLGRHAGRTPG
jgi:monoterpene epsilon-lactone hydrolase